MLTSQGVILATAMAVSAGTIILFDLFRGNYQHPIIPKYKQPLKSCLSSGSKKREEKKKRVKFADDDSTSRKLYKKEAEIQKISCGKEILGLKNMAANREVLYGGILKDRVQRMEYS